MNLFIYSGKRYEPSNGNEKSLVFILSLTTTTRNPRNQLSNLHFSLHYAASAATSAAGSLYRPRVMSLRPQVPLPSPSTHRHPSWHTRTSSSRTPLRTGEPDSEISLQVDYISKLASHSQNIGHHSPSSMLACHSF